MPRFEICPASEVDVPLILQFIKALADYEKLSHKVVATEKILRRTLFGNPRFAEVVIGYEDHEPVGFALFFHNYSTFLGRPGIYLEDLFVNPDRRGRGYGKAFFRYLARVAKERDCGRMEWSVLDWNTPAIDFYKSLGAVPLSDWILFRLIGEPLERLAGQ